MPRPSPLRSAFYERYANDLFIILEKDRMTIPINEALKRVHAPTVWQEWDILCFLKILCDKYPLVIVAEGNICLNNKTTVKNTKIFSRIVNTQDKESVMVYKTRYELRLKVVDGMNGTQHDIPLTKMQYKLLCDLFKNDDGLKEFES
jgi:hypothetical protein